VYNEVEPVLDLGVTGQRGCKKEGTMPVSAYVFIECKPGAAREAAKEVSKIEGVQRANATTGPYDVVALVEAENIHILGDLIMTKIQGLSGVL
jgi:DNA-binding Lrp family transcriptional regulator